MCTLWKPYFNFGDSYVPDDVVVLLCVHESTKVENGVRTYMASYEFQIIKEW